MRSRACVIDIKIDDLKSFKRSREACNCICQTDEFLITSQDLGELKTLIISHDGKGLGDGWFLDSITVVGANAQEVFFPCFRWLDSGSEDGLTRCELRPSKTKEVSYELSVATADCRGAGTDARVFVSVSGDSGESGERPLEKSATSKRPFERGNVDVFSFKSKYLGALRRVVIRHDGSGLGSGYVNPLLTLFTSEVVYLTLFLDVPQVEAGHRVRFPERALVACAVR